MNKLSLAEIEQVIQQAPVEEQRKLLARLPSLLKLSVDDIAWLKLAETSFDFWNNADDAVYDRL